MSVKVITEEYVNSLTERQLVEEQRNWTATQWKQYLCPNGTMTMEEAIQYSDQIIDEIFDEDESVI